MNRRFLITGLASLIAAPAIVKASSLMPIRGIVMPIPRMTFSGEDVTWTATGDTIQRIRFCVIYNHDTGKVIFSGPVDGPDGPHVRDALDQLVERTDGNWQIQWGASSP